MRALVYGFWVLSVLLESLLVGIMLRRKLRKEFPIFFIFVAFDVCTFLIEFPVSFFSVRGYFYVYWSFTIVSISLEFAVLHEIFRIFFRPFESLQKLGDVLYRWASIVMVLIALVMAISSSQTEPITISTLVLTLGRSIRLMQCGLVIFLFLFGPHIGLTPRHHVSGVVLGFGIYAAAQLVVSTMVYLFGGQRMALSNSINEMCWSLAAAIWVVYMLLPEPERRRASQFEESSNWNYALTNINQEKAQNNFLPSVVDTVDRIMNRRESLD
ncbi:MAG TPA: hypothetical protein VEG30_11655 [Terriglobales bacterium]|nr:hypothetical protein [Terriglobales bacterium]